jgi:predicted Zn finger-like uncharacterized protein
MIVGCPSCQTKFRLDDEKFATEIRLRCTKCRTIFKVVKRQPPATAPAAAPVAAPSAGRLKIFVAHESSAFCGAVHKVLAAEPFDVRSFTDGLEVFRAIETQKPDVVLLDVALPSMFGFEVCENIRRAPELAAVKTILIAAIYDKTRYKRTPSSLYGADDYIEKHHIPDDLAAKIYRLTAGLKQEEPQREEPQQEEPQQEEPQQEEPQQEEPQQEETEIELQLGEAAPPSPQEIAEQQHMRLELQQMEVEATTSPPAAPPADQSECHVKARRFARIIVSDIALYNQTKVEQGVREGTFYDLLADDIKEGRIIYSQRVAEEIRSGTNYLDEALSDLVAKKKRELNLQA